MKKTLNIPRERLFSMMPGVILRKEPDGSLTNMTARAGDIYRIYPDDTYETMPFDNEVEGQCFAIWKEQVIAEMERSGSTQFDLLTLDWTHLRATYYNYGISPHDTVAEEMIAQ